MCFKHEILFQRDNFHGKEALISDNIAKNINHFLDDFIKSQKKGKKIIILPRNKNHVLSIHIIGKEKSKVPPRYGS